MNARIGPRKTDINTTASGRTGIDVADWNGNGRLDLITSSGHRVLLYLQTADGRFEPPVKLLRYRSHMAGPSVVDWTGDGYLDIILGGDYGHLSGDGSRHNLPATERVGWGMLDRLLRSTYNLPTTERAHYYVVHGKSLPVPSFKRN